MTARTPFPFELPYPFRDRITRTASDRKMTIVTGGAGFIGSHLVDRLVERGDKVIVIDDLSNGSRANVHPEARLIQMDIRNGRSLRDIAVAERPTAWYHLAALADVRHSVENPAHDASVNVLGTLNVLEAARAVDASVVFTSTGGAIYGADAPRPTTESTLPEPTSPYGAAKLAAEEYVRMHARLHDLGHVILRLANVYGPRQDPHGEAGVVAIFAGRISAREPVTIYGGGMQTRDYVFVSDVVDALVAAGDVGVPRGRVATLNVGTGIETSVQELWSLMQTVAGTRLDSTLAPARHGELQDSALDASSARELLEVVISTPLARGLRDTIMHVAEDHASAVRAEIAARR